MFPFHLQFSLRYRKGVSTWAPLRQSAYLSKSNSFTHGASHRFRYRSRSFLCSSNSCLGLGRFQEWASKLNLCWLQQSEHLCLQLQEWCSLWLPVSSSHRFPWCWTGFHVPLPFQSAILYLIRCRYPLYELERPFTTIFRRRIGCSVRGYEVCWRVCSYWMSWFLESMRRYIRSNLSQKVLWPCIDH